MKLKLKDRFHKIFTPGDGAGGSPVASSKVTGAEGSGGVDHSISQRGGSLLNITYHHQAQVTTEAAAPSPGGGGAGAAAGSLAEGSELAEQMALLVERLGDSANPGQQASAAEELFNAVAESETAREVAGSLNAVAPLVDLLRDGSDSSKMYAAYTLSSLTSVQVSQQQMLEMSAIHPLLEILATCQVTVARKGAVRAIGRLARSPEIATQVVEAGGLGPIVELLAAEDDSLVRRCLIALYFIGADRVELQSAICDAGGLFLCLRLCGSSNVDVQAEATDVVKVLSRCPAAHECILQAGPECLDPLRLATGAGGISSRARSSAFKALHRLETSGGPDMWELLHSGGSMGPSQDERANGGSRASEGTSTADVDAEEAQQMMGQLTAIMSQVVMPTHPSSYLQPLCPQGDSWLQAQAAQAVMDVSAGDPTASRELAQCGVIEPLAALTLSRGNRDGSLYAASALANMASDPTTLDAISASGVISELVDRLSDVSAQEEVAAALQVLADQPQAATLLVNAEAVPELTGCLASQLEGIRLIAGRTLVALTHADDTRVIPQVLSAGGFPLIVAACWHGGEDVQMALVGLVLNMVVLCTDSHEECCRAGVVALLMWLLRSEHPHELQETAAEAIDLLSRSSVASQAVVHEMELQSRMASLVKEVGLHCAVPLYLEHALCSIPREAFLWADKQGAYSNASVAVSELGLELNPPHVDVLMLTALALEPGLTVMEVGSGSGFVSCLLAFVVGQLGHVTGVEMNEMAAFHAESCVAAIVKSRHLPLLRLDFLLRDAFHLRSSVSFDRILVSADCPPEHLEELLPRLNPGGILVAPCLGRLLQVQREGGLERAVVLGEATLTALRLPHELELAENLLHKAMTRAGLYHPSDYPQQSEANSRKGSSVGSRRLTLEETAVPQGEGQQNTGDGSDCDELLLSQEDIQVCTSSSGRKCRLGEGGFGVVYKAIMNGVDEVAMKLVKGDNPSETEMDQFLKEVRVLRSLHHRNIVQFYGACLEPGSLFFVTELMKGGDLYTALRHHPETMRWDRLGKKVMLDIALGINYLHTRRPPMMHRDLKSPNVLLSEEGVAKIADVGMVRTQADLLATAQPVMTPLWAAPEVIRHERASIKADIWSYGILIWELVTRLDITEWQPLAISCQMGGAKQLSLPVDAPPVAVRLFRECTQIEPQARPSAARIVEILRDDSR